MMVKSEKALSFKRSDFYYGVDARMMEVVELPPTEFYQTFNRTGFYDKYHTEM